MAWYCEEDEVEVQTQKRTIFHEDQILHPEDLSPRMVIEKHYPHHGFSIKLIVMSDVYRYTHKGILVVDTIEMSEWIDFRDGYLGYLPRIERLYLCDTNIVPYECGQWGVNYATYFGKKISHRQLSAIQEVALKRFI